MVKIEGVSPAAVRILRELRKRGWSVERRRFLRRLRRAARRDNVEAVSVVQNEHDRLFG